MFGDINAFYAFSSIRLLLYDENRCLSVIKENIKKKLKNNNKKSVTTDKVNIIIHARSYCLHKKKKNKLTLA